MTGAFVAQAPLAATLADRLTAIVAEAAQHIEREQPAFLAYSGGAESGLLLELLRPFRQSLYVVWVAADPLPHMVDHVHRQTEGWQLVELPSDPRPWIAQNGIPTRLLPQHASALGRQDVERPTRGPLMTLEFLCCQAVRSQPKLRWAQAAGMQLMIHGQRRGEGTGLFMPGLATALGMSLWAPLGRWTRADVLAGCELLGVELPEQHAEGLNSFECGMCPAETDPARLAYLRRRYPAVHADVTGMMREVRASAADVLAAYDAALEGVP